MKFGLKLYGVSGFKMGRKMAMRVFNHSHVIIGFNGIYSFLLTTKEFYWFLMGFIRYVFFFSIFLFINQQISI